MHPKYLTLAVLAGCGTDGGGGDVDDVVGRLAIVETEFFELYGSAYGSFVERDPTPDLANDGTCRVYEYPCLGSVGACATPPGYSAGRITVTGLTVPLVMAPQGDGNYYFGESLPADLFAPGATITATATGDTVDGFTLTTQGVETLVSPYANTTQPAFAGQPVTFTWTGSSDARVQLRVNWADICHAGARWYILECDGPDTGSLTVSAEVSNALPRSSFGGCGAQLTRYRRAVISEPGRDIELFVGSADWFDVGSAGI